MSCLSSQERVESAHGHTALEPGRGCLELFDHRFSDPSRRPQLSSYALPFHSLVPVIGLPTFQSECDTREGYRRRDGLGSERTSLGSWN
jgi:hypothetical protein